ncbi:MAG: hypothetical protein HZB37_04775 [Planctomycetes bacterium]|nr:hypothetical protein [Planctomycetota bacterium]
MNKKITFVAIALSFLVFMSCSTVSNIGTDNWRDYYTPGHSKEEITKDFNLYRGKWWNYYVRGRWYAEGGHWDEASGDFKMAVSLRGEDQRSARSYGLHFWEYFARRELGIVYFNQAKYEEAKKELETSLTTADSARTKFYLNKCNEAILKTTKGDQSPPVIKVTSHRDGEIVNTPTVNLQGVAEDDGYVEAMNIRGKRLFVELAEKQLHFFERVTLHAGENVIDIEATDLIKRNVRNDFKLILDVCPPILCLDDILVSRKDGKQVATVKGVIVDDYGVKSLSVNNVRISVPAGKEFEFKQDIVLTEGRTISFKVVDVAGNETRGEQQVEVKATLWPEGMKKGVKYAYRSTDKPILLAAQGIDAHTVRTLLALNDTNAPQPSSGVLANQDEKTNAPSSSLGSGGDNAPPVICADLKSSITYDANLFVSGNVHDDNSVTKLLVNQHPLDIHPGKNVFFNYLLPLQEGENIVEIRAVDTRGNEAAISPVKITKKTFELLETDARYTVALLPLRSLAEAGVPSNTVYSLLLKAFDEEPKRFNFVERDRARLEEILREQKISNTELTSPDTAIKIGKIHAAEGMLFGSVEEDTKGITIALRLVDTETTQILANTDVYDEDKSTKNLEWLMHGLVMKMKQQFPMVQGTVIHVSGNGFHINAGASGGAEVGMKLLLFREIKEGNFVLKEPLDVVARIAQVQKDTSFAKIINTKGPGSVGKDDVVITK